MYKHKNTECNCTSVLLQYICLYDHICVCEVVSVCGTVNLCFCGCHIYIVHLQLFLSVFLCGIVCGLERKINC